MEARNVVAQPAPAAHDGSEGITISGYQLRDALQFLAPDGSQDQLEARVTIQWGPERTHDEGTDPAGLFCWMTDYPEEGSIPLLEPSATDFADPELDRPSTQVYRSAAELFQSLGVAYEERPFADLRSVLAGRLKGWAKLSEDDHEDLLRLCTSLVIQGAHQSASFNAEDLKELEAWRGHASQTRETGRVSLSSNLFLKLLSA